MGNVCKRCSPGRRRKAERYEERLISIAEPVELPIPRGIAGPNLLAETIVKRWDDALPATRLQKIYRRDGLDLARSTLCRMHMARANDLLRPLLHAMWVDAMTVRGTPREALPFGVAPSWGWATYLWAAPVVLGLELGRRVLLVYRRRDGDRWTRLHLALVAVAAVVYGSIIRLA
jgi:hypothetical protein